MENLVDNVDNCEYSPHYKEIMEIKGVLSEVRERHLSGGYWEQNRHTYGERIIPGVEYRREKRRKQANDAIMPLK